MDNSRISGGYLKKLLRGEKFSKTYADEQKRRKKADDEAFAAYCAKAEAEEIADQEASAKMGLIGRARRQKKHEMCAHGAVAREKGQHGQHAEEGFEGTHASHGLPDVTSGRRPGVALFRAWFQRQDKRYRHAESVLRRRNAFPGQRIAGDFRPEGQCQKPPLAVQKVRSVDGADEVPVVAVDDVAVDITAGQGIGESDAAGTAGSRRRAEYTQEEQRARDPTGS